MISRGEVGLILAAVGLANGLLSQVEFSAIVGTVLFSTLVTPPLLRALFVKHPSAVSGKGELSEDGKNVPDPVRTQ
jgi:Kef-type K+ transport system membrane component KefB